MTMRFLPALDQTLQPPTPSGGADWSGHGAGLGALGQYSASLSVPTSGVPAERLKSVPNPWARLLLFEQALFSKRHPCHAAILNEWRGLLGLIGLSNHLELPFRAISVDIQNSKGAGESLLRMIPDGDRVDVWGRVGLLYVGDELLGGTSSRTLVFTGIRPLTTGEIPFQQGGRLIDPGSYYTDKGDRQSLALLADWISRTRTDLAEAARDVDVFLGASVAGPNSVPLPRLGSVLRLLETWEAETNTSLESIGRPNYVASAGFAESIVKDVFPNQHPAYLTFSRLKRVIAAEIETENGLRVSSGDDVVFPGRNGLLFQGGQLFTGNIGLPNGMTRAVSSGKFQLSTSAAQARATLPDLGEYFEGKLIPVSDADPKLVRTLELDGTHYLFPLKKEILDHLTVDQVLQWVRISGSVATGAIASLEIPLVNGLKLVYQKKFSTGDTYTVDAVATPSVAVWPDFQSPTWKHYFFNVRQRARGPAQLQLTPLVSELKSKHEEGTQGLFWGVAETPPRAWQGRFQSTEGILLQAALPMAPVTDAVWEISIDFGSTHTRVFRSSYNAAGVKTADEVALKPRAQSLFGEDNSLQFMFFIGTETKSGSPVEAPSLVWLPLDRNPSSSGRADWLPPDGVMYWGAVEDAPNTQGLRGNLKWHRDDNNDKAVFHSFVSQLYLSASAEAAAAGASIESLITAYPSVLPSHLRNRHRQEWRQLQPKFGVLVKDPRSESAALASFLVSQGATIAVNLLAVDIGGSTSDITVWSRGAWAQGDSIRLAGDILGRLVASDAESRNAIAHALSQAPFNHGPIEWTSADPSKNELIFNSLLRSISQNSFFQSERDTLARNLCIPNSAGERIVAHLAYLFATVSFLLGMMVRRNNINADRFEIRFAGKGSEFLHWLEALAGGATTSLPSAFFKAGHGSIPNAQIDCIPPGAMAKQEVGRGLLSTAVAGGETSTDRTTLVGESGFNGPNGQLIWSDELTFDKLAAVVLPPEPTDLSALTHLQAFVAAFESEPAARKAAKALGLTPAKLNLHLRDQIHNRIFGAQGPWAASRDTGLRDDALLEPFFITEAKVLLEEVTGNRALFFR
jgi:hypothetical protein